MKRGRKSAWKQTIEPRLEEIKAWARDGATNKEIAEALGIGLSTFMHAKAANEQLQDALKINKTLADIRVENSLYSRAVGCTITETISEYLVAGDKKIEVKRRVITREIPPDPTSGFFWMQNRQPDKWLSRRNIELTGKDGGPIETVALDKKDYAKVREQMLKDDDC